MTSKGVLRTDGGSRGNPGPAAAGFVLENHAGDVICSGGRYIGETTNNVAEYEALLWGLENALESGIKELKVLCDSELVVKQLLGQYRVKHPNMIPLFQRARELFGEFGRYEISHVRREANALADELVNQALDCRQTVGTPCVDGSSTRQCRLFD